MWAIIRCCSLVTLLCCASGFNGNAQAPVHKPVFNNTIDANINGYWEYLPRDYSTDTDKRYPLLIFLHGAGAQGSVQDTATLSKLLVYGPPKLIESGNFPESFTVNGTSFRYIVLSPQIKVGITRDSSIIDPATILNFINHAKATYRVDFSRIYLAGLSMGGGGIWDFAGSSPANAGIISAIAVSAGAGKLNSTEASVLARSEDHVLAGHNIPDNIIEVGRTINNIQYITDEEPQHDPLAFYWDSPGTLGEKHNSWSRMFEDINPGTTEGGNLTDSLGMNIYEWFLQYSTIGQAPLPLTWLDFQLKPRDNATQLTWTVSNQLNVSHFEVEKSIDGQNWQSISTVTARPGNGTITYTFTDNMVAANRVYYRIRQVDEDKRYSYSKTITREPSQVQINPVKVYPSPFSTTFTVELQRKPGERITLLLRNALGKIAGTKNMVSTGQHTFTWHELSHLPSGMYYLQVISNGETVESRSIIKQ